MLSGSDSSAIQSARENPCRVAPLGRFRQRRQLSRGISAVAAIPAIGSGAEPDRGIIQHQAAKIAPVLFLRDKQSMGPFQHGQLHGFTAVQEQAMSRRR